ncbi:MAG: glycoside hydrolase family 3 protein [Proteobacteria bacterium]|nr:glycoside hydrolase family 3 protein [Pseudomonadota bacterium]
MTPCSPTVRDVSSPLAALLLGALLASPAIAHDPVHPEAWPSARSPALRTPAIEARVEELLARMSVEEKVGQVIQSDISAVEPDDLRRYPLGSVLAGGDSGVHGDERAPASAWLDLVRAYRAVSVEARPGHVPIPVIFGIDAVHGHNNIVGAVIFPHNIGLGATHDSELARRVARATAEEVAATGIEWAFAPTLANPRDVRWGRSYEGFAQDPALIARFAAAYVEGLQGTAASGNAIQAGHVAATAKHFLGDGGTFEGRDEGDDRIAEAELIREHAAGYPAAIDAGVLTVMASFSSWRGAKMHGNADLLTRVLKERMGFDGFVVGDWNGHAQLPGCFRDHCAAVLNAGVDMLMAPYGWKRLYDNTVADVRSGAIPAARLDDAVRRILRVKLRLGLFDAERPYEGRLDLLGSPAHRATAREAVRKSLVLLKNDGVLPIRANARVLVTGLAADDIGAQCGGWTISWQGADTRKSDFPNGESIFAGIKAAIRAGGGTLVEARDSEGSPKPDVAVVVYGEKPYAEMQGDLKLAIYNARMALDEIRFLKGLGIPVVSVFLSGRPLWVNQEINASDAFVAAWLPGTEGGGVADVLIGTADGQPRHDFAGTLPFDWPSVALLPPLAAGPAQQAPPLFAHGYGLSYGHPGRVPRLPEVIGTPR